MELLSFAEKIRQQEAREALYTPEEKQVIYSRRVEEETAVREGRVSVYQTQNIDELRRQVDARDQQEIAELRAFLATA